MTPTGWALLVLGGALLILFAVWNYRTRELRVSGTGLLIGLRAAALVLALLLLLNPQLPWTREGDVGAWRLLDLSLSMGAAEGAPWQRARAGTAATRVVGFGDLPRALSSDTLASLVPDQLGSRLGPALRVAAEGGAESVVVLSDLRIADLAGALQEAAGLGLTVGFDDAGQALRNVGVASFVLPEVAETDGFEIELTVFGEGLRSGDSARVEVREEDTLVGTTTVAVGAPGAVVGTRLRLPGPKADGPLVRYTVRASVEGDAFPEDDERVAYAFKQGEEGGLVLVSWSPDFEPRMLAPVLQAATGLRVTTLLRVGSDRFLLNDQAGPSVRSLSAEQVAQRLAAAELAVLHGVGADRPAWLDDFMVRARRLLIFPVASDALTPLGLTASGPVEAEWTPEPVLPASPIAAELAGLRLEAAPPLTAAITVAISAGWFPALQMRRGGRGVLEPALALGGSADRRWALALGQGFYRWALRSDGPADAYRRLWTGVGQWLVGGSTAAAGDRVRPERPVVARGSPVLWAAPGLAGDSVRITLEGPAHLDTVLTVGTDERALMPSLVPGTYRFSAVAGDGTDAALLGEGRFDVERFSDDLRIPTQDPERIGAELGSGSTVRMLGRQRLRTTPIPFLLLIGLLITEWIARRRRGLR